MNYNKIIMCCGLWCNTLKPFFSGVGDVRISHSYCVYPDSLFVSVCLNHLGDHRPFYRYALILQTKKLYGILLDVCVCARQTEIHLECVCVYESRITFYWVSRTQFWEMEHNTQGWRSGHWGRSAAKRFTVCLKKKRLLFLLYHGSMVSIGGLVDTINTMADRRLFYVADFLL